MEFESQTCLQQPPVAAELCSTVSLPAVAMYVGPGHIATNMNFRSHLRFRRQLYTDVRHPPSFWKFPSQFSAVSGSSKLFGPEKMVTFYLSTVL